MDDGVTRNRRLGARIMLAHQQARDEQNMEVANLLLQAQELDRPGIGGKKSESRKSTEQLEAPFERNEQASGG